MCSVGPDSFIKASKMEVAMDALVEVFQAYSDQSYDSKYTLTYLELKKLVDNEMDHYVKRSWDPVQMSRLMDCLDKNHDNKVCFEELVFLIGRIIIQCHPFFKGYKGNVATCGTMSW